MVIKDRNYKRWCLSREDKCNEVSVKYDRFWVVEPFPLVQGNMPKRNKYLMSKPLVFHSCLVGFCFISSFQRWLFLIAISYNYYYVYASDYSWCQLSCFLSWYLRLFPIRTLNFVSLKSQFHLNGYCVYRVFRCTSFTQTEGFHAYLGLFSDD